MLLLKILFDERGGTLAITRKTANTLITAAGFNTNYAEIEAVINGDIDDTNIEDDAVTAAKLNSDVVRANYGLVQHTTGALYVDLSDTNPGLELTDGGLRVKSYGLNQRTANGLEVGRTGDLLLSSAASTPDGWTDVSATYEGKFIRISATALSTGTGSGNTDSHTLTEAEMPSHTHGISVSADAGAGTNPTYISATNTLTSGTTINPANTGGSNGHTHTITAYVPAYVSTKMFQKS